MPDLRATNRAMALSIQRRARETSADADNANSLGAALTQLVYAGELIAPWWSANRDVDLRRFWKSCDHLAGAVYAMSSRISTTDFKVVPRDKTVKLQVDLAHEYTELLLESTEFGKGWNTFSGKVTEELNTQDNGFFAEIIGDGDPLGPLNGKPISLAVLDAGMCSRTSNPTFPVIFRDAGGRRYRLHYTRVMFASQQPSPHIEMHNVGFCSTSRCIAVAQTLIDMLRYKQEKIGSRPPRLLIVGEKNISAPEILSAFAQAGEMMDSRSLSRFSQIIALAPKRGRGEIGVEVKDLASVPDGFDERESTFLAMFAIALAFGVDARELWPASIAGATKADALIQHLKARGKGIGLTRQIIARQINQKFLPAALTFVFDTQDDEQDMLQADVQDQRAERRERDLNAGATDIRTERELMLDKGDITEAQFESMELESGRLKDGSPILALFYSPDDDTRELLRVAIDNPLDVRDNNPEEAIRAIDESIRQVLQQIMESPRSSQKRRARQALAALEYLRSQYEPEPVPEPESASGRLVGGARRHDEPPDYNPVGVRDVVEGLGRK